MRTTVTIDPDAEALLRKAMRERDLSFKQVLNESIREALGHGRAKPGKRFEQITFDMGQAAGGPHQGAFARRGTGRYASHRQVAASARGGQAVKLPDVNVLLNAVKRASPEHTCARDWLEAAFSAPAGVGRTWYEQAGFGQALATMSSDPLIQGCAGERFVVCPACGRENAVVSMPGSENHGGREAIVGLRAPH